MKITKRNWKKIVRDRKSKDTTVTTIRGGKVKAKNAKFELRETIDGDYTIVARRKKKK